MESLDALASRMRTADIVDAMGRLHRHRCHLLDLVVPTSGRRLFGPVVTINYFPACRAARQPEHHTFSRLFYQAIEDGAEGHVLVLASNGYTDASLGGGTKISRVQNHWLAGVLADARLRDFAELEHYDLAIYCRGETTRWGGDAVTTTRRTVQMCSAGWQSVPETTSSPTPPAQRSYQQKTCGRCCIQPTRSWQRTRRPSSQSEVKAQTRRQTVTTDACAGAEAS
jgi:regulator of RNase E activity RraA